MSGQLLFVNYHYIRDARQYRHPGIHPLSMEDFAAQVDQLGARFDFPSAETVRAFLLDGVPLAADSACLTFDDGLVDHYNAAREVLAPRGIQGMFFVCTRPLLDGLALSVHKTHWLRATTEPGRFTEELMELLNEKWRTRVEADPRLDEAQTVYIYDTPETARLKYLLGFILPVEEVDRIGSLMLTRRGISEKAFCTENYMGREQLCHLHDEGHVLGVHGHTHFAFPRLPEKTLAAELQANGDYLAGIAGHRPWIVSFPYGRSWALPDDTAAFCEAHDFPAAVTLEQGLNGPDTPRHRLRRLNPNDLETLDDPHE